MCEFASFVLTKDHEFWLEGNDSHEAIIEHNHIHQDGVRGPNIVRVEITPCDIPEDLSSWKYHVDQDIFPDWYDAPECEQRSRDALLRRADENRWFAHEDGNMVVAGYAGTATAGNCGTATAGNRGTATAGDDGTATAGNRGEIRIRYWDPKSDRYRVAVGYVGEDGIDPDTAYVVVDGRLAKKLLDVGEL